MKCRPPRAHRTTGAWTSRPSATPESGERRRPRSGRHGRRRPAAAGPTGPRTRSSTTGRPSLLLQLAPAARPVVGDDLLEHRAQRPRVDGLAGAYRDRARGRVVVATGDDVLRVGHD